MTKSLLLTFYCIFLIFARVRPYNLNVTAEIQTHYIRQYLVLYICNLYLHFFVVVCKEWLQTWSFVAVDNLLQVSSCSMSRDVAIVKNDSLSYHYLSITSQPSTFDIFHKQNNSVPRIDAHWKFISFIHILIKS